MQELIPAIWDDRELAEHGRKIAAIGTVTLGYQGQWYELDLHGVNNELLEEQVRPWLAAGRKTAHVLKPKPVATGRTPRKPNSYYRDLRVWAAAQDPPVEIAQDAHGKYNYTPAVRQRFDDHLASQAAADGTA